MAFLADIRRAFTAAWAPALASPWTPHPSNLESWLWSDIFDVENLPMTRAEAMTIPSMVRARNLVATTIAQDHLVAFRDGRPVDPPIWARRTDHDLSWFHEILWTVDDLMFEGWALWALERDWEGSVTRFTRVNPARWSLDREGWLEIDGRSPEAAEVCLIPGIHEGILTFGGQAIRLASKLARAASAAADTPSATLELHQTGGDPLSEDQILKLRQQWAEARRGKFSGVAYTNKSIETKEHRSRSEHLLIEGRAQSDVEMARITNISARKLDASPHRSSLTYETREDATNELADDGLAPYMAAISARLSLDDMTPRGTVVRFSLEDRIGAQHIAADQTTDAAGRSTATPAASARQLRALPGAANQ